MDDTNANSGSTTIQIRDDHDDSAVAAHDGSVDELRAALDNLRLRADDVDGVRRATELGLKSMKLFRAYGSVEVLDISLDAFEEAVKLTPKNHANRADTLSNLSNALHVRFQKTGSEIDLGTAIELGKEAVRETPAENRVDLASNLCSLGNLLTSRYKRPFPTGGSVSDFDAAFNCYQEAIKAAPESDPQRSLYCLCLGASFRDRYRLNGLVDDWNGAVKSYRAAANAASSESLRSASLNDLNLILTLRLQSEFDKSEPEWDAAVRETEEEQSKSGDTANRPNFLGSLGTLSLKRFRKSNSMKALDLAVETLNQACQSASDSYPNKFEISSNLGASLQHRFEMTGSLADLDEAIATHRKTLQLVPHTPQWKSLVLDNLGGALWRRAETTGSMENLNEGIESFIEAVELETTNGVRRGYRLNNLAGALLERYSRTSAVDDLKEAVNAWQQAIELIPTGDQERPGILSSLANGLREQFDWFGEMKYLDASITANQQAVKETPENYPYRGGHLNNLAVALYRRAERTRLMQDVNDAVEMSKAAIKATPKGHHEMPSYLNSLCSALQLRYSISEKVSIIDIDAAIEIQQQGLKSTPKDHPGTATHLLTLAKAFQLRFEHSHSVEDRNSAVDAYERSVGSRSSPPRQRIMSARKAADLIYNQDPEKASKLLSVAVDLLPLTNPRTGHRDDKQVLLGQFRGLASDAASLAVRAERMGSTDLSSDRILECLRLLELGRGIMGGMYLDTRSDTTELKMKYSETAQKFDLLRSELDAFSSSAVLLARSDLKSQITRRYNASKEFEELVRSIRQLEGFERFLLGPTISELKNLASLHSIVYVNASRFGADAFLITGKELQHLSLPDLTYVDVEKKATELIKMIESHNAISARRDRIMLKEILKWLWDVVVEPILIKLGYSDPHQTGDKWPRVIWIPVGELNLFPLHAAGIHDDSSNRTTLDRVISTYSPTLRALSHAKAQIGTAGREHIQTILLASMPTTPNKSPLPYAVQEIDTLDSLLPATVSRVIQRNPTKSDVLEALRKSSVAHFACHGQVDSNPSKSRLLFRDWESNPLSVADISEIELSSARLIVLSACHAANIRNITLLDEGIHLAGACQLAGFPTVIGTLWQVQDQFSPTVSDVLYRTMLVQDDDVLDINKAAEGLHFAVRKVREDSRQRKFKAGKGTDDPMSWAPYIHVGV